MEQLEGRLTTRALVELVRSAVAANMNMLRVWGGGTFAPDAFYNECDELGILLLHDFMYAQHGHTPSATPEQAAEVAHQVRRLSSHPSLVTWVACNECKVQMYSATELYVTFVMAIAAREDPSRPVWPSSPSLGWHAGVRLSDGTPDGTPLEARDCTEPARSRARKAGTLIETHGPYLRSSGFAAVDGLGAVALPVPTNLPLVLPEQLPPTGTAHPNRFVSEMGAVGMPSFESFAPSLHPERWALHAGQPAATCAKKRCVGSNVMARRNFPCDSLILAYFGKALRLASGGGQGWFNRTGIEPFRAQLYLCSVAQALWVKSAVEASRAKNELGLLLWSLNDQWPTGGWGTLEYGSDAVAGQVLGGRWKPIHYLLRRTLFADVIATCGAAGRLARFATCYVRNDGATPFHGSVRISAVEFSTGKSTLLTTFDARLPAGPGALRLLPTLPLDRIDGSTHLLLARCNVASAPAGGHRRDPSASGGLVSRNEVLLAPPDELLLPAASVHVAVQSLRGDGDTVKVKLTANATALFVHLTTLANGRFSDNFFLLPPGSRTVLFLPFGPLDEKLLRSSVRVDHLQHRLGTCLAKVR